MTDDLLRSHLDSMLDLRHPLAVLARKMPWDEIESTLAPCFARKRRAGRTVPGFDMFGPTAQAVGAGISNAGRPRHSIRLTVDSLYLQHAFGESDVTVVEKWAENPYWQYFFGNEYFETRFPCAPTGLARFRQLIGEAGVCQQ